MPYVAQPIDTMPIDMTICTQDGEARVYQHDDEQCGEVRVLEVEGAIESVTYVGDRYCDLVLSYTKLFDCMFYMMQPISRVLMLGGGGCSYPKHLIATHPECSVDVVEIDETILDVAREYFYVDRLIEEYELEGTERLNMICDDALHYLHTCRKTYDAIIQDCFYGLERADELSGVDAARVAREKLTSEGVYLVNVVSSLAGTHAQHLREQVHALEQVFRYVRVVPLSPDEPYEVDNNLVIASDGTIELPEAREACF